MQGRDPGILVTCCIDLGALICPSAFPSQASVLVQRRRYDLGRELKEAERCGCCDGLAQTRSLQSKEKRGVRARMRVCISV